jgi:hypothetical protein
MHLEHILEQCPKTVTLRNASKAASRPLKSSDRMPYRAGAGRGTAARRDGLVHHA